MGSADNFNQEWLLANIPLDKTILRKWLKAGYIDKHALHPTDEGVPQGGVISPVIANLALDGLEAKLREKYPTTSKKSRAAKVNLVRFGDDFIITGSSKELLEGWTSQDWLRTDKVEEGRRCNQSID